ncbi:hypothetical protein A9Q96_04270 [Rhodobacterales bacterium 52_120_T64]|nr:hypothetical protein A9Q96_04270 [Rhodobacterales bacterium 52_120_T64]
MKIKNLITSTILAIGVMTSAASAVEWDTLYSRGNWRLDLNYYDNGSRSCESRSTNSQDYVFSLFTWDDGDYVVRFTHEDWEFGDDAVDQDFVVAIDRRGPWEISGEKWDNVLQIIITPPSDTLTRFFGEVRAGNTLYLRNANGQEITRFSLSGTTATLNQHRNCESQILAGIDRSDPFK